MSSAYQALDSIKSQLHYKLERLTTYGDKATKASFVEFIESLQSDLDLIDLDSLHDDCYSADQIQDLVNEEMEERERDRERDLRRLDPEEHRARFGVLNGGAA